MPRIIGFAGGAFINVSQGEDATTFDGPPIANLTLSVDEAITPRDFSPRFSAPSAMTFSVVGVLPTGLSLSAAGVLSGTPTVLGLVSSLEIRADDGSTTADSNSFSIDIVNEVAMGDGVEGYDVWWTTCEGTPLQVEGRGCEG